MRVDCTTLVVNNKTHDDGIDEHHRKCKVRNFHESNGGSFSDTVASAAPAPVQAQHVVTEIHDSGVEDQSCVDEESNNFGGETPPPVSKDRWHAHVIDIDDRCARSNDLNATRFESVIRSTDKRAYTDTAAEGH